MDYVIGLGEDERQRFIKTVTELGKPLLFVRLNQQPKNSMMKLLSLKQLKQDLLNYYNHQKKGKYVKRLQKLKQRLINLCHNQL